ncbi:YbaN family protein [Noviherbaspirillum aridicola]|uniref:Inner membrane protein n=1 Tax=Noviherbaspirillum aridicola TaxID=2849687 RepID=A0ABQ4Q7I9_9BURK|nr:YbaN family protein [Noviherbaspirillum aridicola]GIZ53012.1 hypothetical protein NCCP691_30260 [Noviherbaspirillum aridicola]
MKFLLNLVGCIAVVLAVLGVFLPLLPTTPFLLLASACFIRGSDRMHRWLMNNRLFGEYLHNIETRRGMPLRAKVVALALMWPSLLWSMHIVGRPLVTALLLVTGSGVTVYILRMKTLKNEGRNDAA